MSMRTSFTALVVAALLASCSAADSSGSGSESPAASKSAAESKSPTESDEPSKPLDESCGDGACEIEVAEGDTVKVPKKYGLGPIDVTRVTDDEVTMEAPLTGSSFGVSGCSGGGGTTVGGGGVSINCGEGSSTTVNDAMLLTIVEIRDAAAVVRIEPAE